MSYLPKTNKHYYRYFSLLAVVILGVVSILGTGGGDGGVSTPPTITTVSPAQSSDSALVTALVTAQFSIDMDPGSVSDPNNFTVVAADMSPVTASNISYDVATRVVTFTPNADLTSGEQYIATISSAVQDTSGNNPLSSDYVWSFDIAPAQKLVSTDGTGAVGNLGVVSTSPSGINGSGEYIVFASADDLIAGTSTGGIAQIYRKNTVTGRVEFVSLGSSGLLADGPCANPRISDDGRFVVFSSRANNLDLSVTLPSTNVSHIYFKDMRDGSISLLDVNVNNPNQAGNGDSTQPDMSGIPITDPQGRHVVFESVATDLVVNDTNTMSDIFYVNAATGGIERVSVDTNDNQTNGPSNTPRVSDDGRRIVFESTATNLVAGDTNGVRDVFLRVRNATVPPTGTTTRLSVDSSNTQATGPSSNPDINADGNLAVFQSDATDLILSDTNGVTDIFLRDINTSATSRLSEDANGTEVTGASTLPSISSDGQYVTFESQSAQLVTPDTNGVADIFVRDKDAANTISRLSVDNLGVQGNQASVNAAMSSDGRYVSFTTPWAFDATDSNGQADIYRAYNAALP